MADLFEQLVQQGPLAAIAAVLLAFLLFVLVALIPVAISLYVAYFVLTLPMRRNERARMFLDLLEMGLKEGRTPEVAIAGAASSRDVSLGARFYLLAAWLEQGMPLGRALEHVPRLLPPQVAAMLKAGERIGDVAKVLPACRQLLGDSLSQVRGALNYVILLTFVMTPFSLFLPLYFRIAIVPKFKEVFEGVTEGGTLPAFTRFVFEANPLMTGIQIALVCLIWLLAVAYIGGPRLRGWFRLLAPWLVDALFYRLPWRKKRLQRDFSAMLAVLIDAEVPEAEAVLLAAETTANRALLRRAGKVRDRLKEGVKLPEAIRAIDDSGELRWRLTNALRRAGGFLRALSGWHEALAAKAFQLEQSAAQLTTTLLLLLNGAMVAAIAIAVFLAFVQLINQGVLW